MYIIAGLGNPGKKYENTRHNMGFLAVDLLAEKYGIRIDKIKFKALVGEGRIAGQKVLLVKPQTYMNLSGQSIVEVMNFYKVEIENLIVIYDDIDIPTGTIRLRKKGSAGGHNGIKDIISATGSDEFCRLKIGIQHPQRQRVVDWVLTPFSKTDQPLIDDAIEKADDALEDWLNGMPFDQLMNKFN